MNNPTDAQPTEAEPLKGPTGTICLIASFSVALVVVSIAGRPFDFWNLLYDLGVGVGIATAVSLMVSVHLKKFDKLQRARHDAIKLQLAKAVPHLRMGDDERKGPTRAERG